MTDHTPDQFLMGQIKRALKDGPLSIAKLCEETGRHPKNVRQALSDLQHYGKVELHPGGHCYQLTQGGPVPPRAA